MERSVGSEEENPLLTMKGHTSSVVTNVQLYMKHSSDDLQSTTSDANKGANMSQTSVRECCSGNGVEMRGPNNKLRQQTFIFNIHACVNNNSIANIFLFLLFATRAWYSYARVAWECVGMTPNHAECVCVIMCLDL